MSHDEYVDLLKSTLLKQLKKSVLDLIFSKISFLAWGPLGPLTGLVVEKVLELAIYQGELAIYLMYTDFRVARQGKVYYNALKENLRVQKEGTDEEKRESEQKVKDTFTELTKLTF